ncbi:MAG: hypothetical protein SFU86_03730 [Pirellulaceae bacterium]|nr:hypothetical protein [Pirellulaceae bacterium]
MATQVNSVAAPPRNFGPSDIRGAAARVRSTWTRAERQERRRIARILQARLLELTSRVAA